MLLLLAGGEEVDVVVSFSALQMDTFESLSPVLAQYAG